MAPAVNPRSIVMVIKQNRYFVGDVISYKHAGIQDRIITHRIFEIGYDEDCMKNIYKTKGDANIYEDAGYVFDDQIVGKMVFSFP